MSTNSDKIDFSRAIYEMKRHWMYFIISFVIVMGVATLYMIRKNPVYAFHASVMIEQQERSNSTVMSQVMKTFSLGGISGGGVDDELVSLQSRSLLEETIRALGMNYTYHEKSGIKKTSLYKKSPILLSTDIDLDTLPKGMNFKIQMTGDGKVDVKVTQGFFKTLYNKNGLQLPAKVELPQGTFMLEKTDFYKPAEERSLTVAVQSTAYVAEEIEQDYMADVPSLKSNNIELSYEDDDIQRGKDFLNTMLSLYNTRRLNDERRVAEHEIAFIDSRLALIADSLTAAEKQLEAFKTDNNITDLEAEAKVLLEQTSANKASIVGLQTQLAIFDSICEFLDDPENRYSMIPVTSGVDYESAAKSIEAYNELILQRTKLDISAKSDNMALVALNRQIDGMREGVVSTMKKARESAEIAYNDFVREDSKYAVRLKNIPSHERRYIDLARDREIKNSLYVFLLEQRESNALKSGAAPIGRIINPAYHDLKKVAPKGSMVCGIGVLLALLIPTIVCWSKALRMKRIVLRQDIGALTDYPVVAELEAPADYSSISSTGSAMAEFSKLRNTILSSQDSIGVIAVASPHGDDATSYFSVGLAAALLPAEKRTVIVATADSSYPPIATWTGCGHKQPLSAYLDHTTDSVADITATSEQGFDVISAAGDCNERILSPRFVSLIETLKASYDIVIVGGGTFGDYSSLQPIANLSDRIISVVKSGITKKEFKRLDAEMKATKTKAGIALIKA